MASEAKARAKAEADKRQGAEEAKIGESVAKAEAEIRAARDEALGHVREIARDTALAIVTRLTGETASKADLDAALS